MERIEMRDKSHRSTKKIHEELKEEPKVYMSEPPAVSPTKDGYLVVMVSYLDENNGQVEVCDVEATIRGMDESEFRKELSKCRGGKFDTFTVINKYSPINRYHEEMKSALRGSNMSSGYISIGNSDMQFNDLF